MNNNVFINLKFYRFFREFQKATLLKIGQEMANSREGTGTISLELLHVYRLCVVPFQSICCKFLLYNMKR